MSRKTLSELLPLYKEYMRMMQYSDASVSSISYCLKKFVTWAEERSFLSPRDITEDHLMQYQRWVFLYRKENGDVISTSYQQSMVSHVKGFFRFLRKRKYILFNPASELNLPRTPALPPKHVLTPPEVEKIVNTIDTDSLLGIRNRTIVELLYSTGVRRKELQKCAVIDIDLQSRIMNVLHGKGGTRRRIPIGKRACLWVERYLEEVRPNFLRGRDPGTLFISHLGKSLCKEVLGRIVRQCMDDAGIEKQGRCHLFRHSMATSMLDNGADVRHIQALLGHKRLNSTQIYTHVSIKTLKEVHERTHPARLDGVQRWE